MQQQRRTAGEMRPLRNLELFAGVGGFRLGLNGTQCG